METVGHRSGAMVPQTGLKGTGVLVPLTGPSGVGKGQLLAAISEEFSGHEMVRFPARIEAITDPITTISEETNRVLPFRNASLQTVSVEQFGSLEKAGGLAVYWQIEGHNFGIPSSIIDDLAQGKVVVVNVARQVIEELRRQHSRVHVVYVTANRDRLSGTSSQQIEIPAPPVTVIDNSGPLIEATEELRRVLETYIP